MKQILLLCAVFFYSISGGPALGSDFKSRVAVISIDGLRPDALEKANTPHLDTLRRLGRYTDQARSVLPSKTIVNHASMVSGVGVDRHRLSFNFWVPWRQKIQAPTIFELATDHGLKTAFIVAKSKLAKLIRDGDVNWAYYPRFKVSDPLAVWEDIFPAHLIGKIASKVIIHHQPDLLFIHIADVDRAGHRHGWMSVEQIRAVERADGAVGAIVKALIRAKIYLDTTLLITADHGGYEKKHISKSKEDPYYDIHTRIPLIAVGPGATEEMKEDIHTWDIAPTAAKILNLPVPDEWRLEGQPIF